MKELTTWFGLKRQPFEKDIKPKDLFATEALCECTARLDHLKRTGGIMLLTGDPGAGKTVAIRRFCDALNDNLYRTIYTPLATLSCIDILRHINQLLGLPQRNAKSALFAQIQHEILESREQRGRTVVLVIDEAQLLQIGPLQELRLLTNFKMDSVEPFILILTGQSDLDRIMDYAILEPFTQRLRLRYHLPPLTAAETGTMKRLTQTAYAILKALDIAASDFGRGGRYRLGLERRELDSDGLIELLLRWCDDYPIASIEDPLAEPMIHKDFPGGPEDLQEYTMEVVEGIKNHLVRDPSDPQDTRWEYTYNERLFAYKVPGLAKPIDQIEIVAKKLAETPYSRRAQAITWKVWEDNECYDPACLQSVWCRLTEDGEKLWLNTNIRFRSNDAYKAAFMNMFALVQLQKLIASKIADRLGRAVHLGRYVHMADSYHIYGSYFKEFEERFILPAIMKKVEDMTATVNARKK